MHILGFFSFNSKCTFFKHLIFIVLWFLYYTALCKIQ